MDPPAPTPETTSFWDIAEALLTDAATSIGTLMKVPCLRVDGHFFATCDHRSGDPIVKLPANASASSSKPTPTPPACGRHRGQRAVTRNIT